MKIKKLILVALFVSLFTSAQASAATCGVISGSMSGDNTSVGTTYFDEASLVDLSILGLGNGLAPGDAALAACSSETLVADQYQIDGVAWNDNLGFIDFSVTGNPEPVIIGPKAGSKRQLSGYAWNSVFGYIQMDGGATYGVTMAANGNLSGWGYSEAGVYLKFDGVNVKLPTSTLPVPKPGTCKDPGRVGPVCLEIPELSVDPREVIADGEDGYYVYLDLDDSKGQPVGIEKYKGIVLTFSWKDTVKINQMAGKKADSALVKIEEPWKFGQGAVVYKPVSVKMDLSDFVFVENGLYRMKKKISSYAPTTNANISYTTNTLSPIPLQNDIFLEPFTNDVIETNALEIKGVKYGPDKDIVFVNGKTNLALKFTPALSVGLLYADDLKDVITAYRGLPVPIFTQTAYHAESNLSASTPVVDYILDFSEEKTAQGGKCSSDEAQKFNFNFVGTSFSNVDKSSVLDNVDFDLVSNFSQMTVLAELTGVGEDSPCTFAEAPSLRTELSYYVGKTEVKYYSNKLPRAGGQSVANTAAEIRGNVYAQSSVSVNKDVAVSQETGSVNVNVVRDIVSQNVTKYIKNVDGINTGTCVINFISDELLQGSGCTKEVDYKHFQVGTEHIYYFKNGDVKLDFNKAFGDIEEGNWNGDIMIVVDGGNIYVENNVYNGTDSDATNNGQYLGLIAFQTAPDNGHLYLGSDVTNLQANIVVDGTMFSWEDGMSQNALGEPIWASTDVMIKTLNKQIFIQGNVSSRNTIGGADLDAGGKAYLLLGTGEVIEGTSFSVEERRRAQLYDLNYLRFFKLELAQGVDEEGNTYAVDQKCGSALNLDKILEAFSYKTWQKKYDKGNATASDEPSHSCGQKGLLTGGSDCKKDFYCDGINPLKKYSETVTATSGPDGDLVAPSKTANPGVYARGLDGAEAPVYIYYLAPSSTSFVFSQSGSSQLK
ncbi:hypothetical protein JKY72_00150 [Candidatus Gracilibacteria bacterium]|nr:hypothetical protein [Candidatus Gracilibacteria bacterium]